MAEPANEKAPDDFFRAYKLAAQARTPAERAEWIYQQRIGNRGDASSISWLNELLRAGAVDVSHVDNPMYCALLASSLSEEELRGFLQQYYWGSGYGFQRIVLPNVLKRPGDDAWRTYIKSIIREENTPLSHCAIFASFVESLGFELGESDHVANKFVQSMLHGYSTNIGFSLGYATGIETEADFQIALVYVAMMARYPSQVADTDYFPIHLSEYGEELHAQMTCQVIEEALAKGVCTRHEVERGFRGAIADTRDYMIGIYQDVVSGRETASI